MIQVNENYFRLQGSYLFSEIAKRIREYQAGNPNAKIIKLGIGDVTEPLPESVINGLKQGVEDMANPSGFHGYGPEAGYEFLRDAINQQDFQSRGVQLSSDEIFISTGAKEDTANFQELFAQDVRIAVTDPVYPVYVDSNVMSGRSGEFKNGRYEAFEYLDCTADNHFKPSLPKEKVDLIYLCYPNNPTGAVLTKDELKVWVDYARENQALILFDAAYVAFIREENVPHSIYEIEGAKEVAVEFRSLSKTAGFTGTRCAYTVVPRELKVYNHQGEIVSLRDLWFRRQSTKFNGVAYLIQKGAQAVFTEQGQKEVRALTDYYLGNAAIIREAVESLGFVYSGGVNSPYVWFKVPDGFSSWDFFDHLLKNANVVGTPGSGFGKSGEGYFRLSAFGERKSIQEAVERIKKLG